MSFSDARYERMTFNRCGTSGLALPAISLGCWHNFGDGADLEEAKRMLHAAFDLGVTHFDLANNYGPPPGSAERNVGRLLEADFRGHRDELIISSKAGFRMWPGPYGDGGSRKSMLASLDQSLTRLNLDYVDIFYHHRYDDQTPTEETMLALDQAVRSGRALYAGISNYSGARTVEAVAIARELRLPLVIHQASYHMLNRWVEDDLLDYTGERGLGVIAFCPLAQGVLTNKYADGVPQGSRADGRSTFLKPERIQAEQVEKVRRLAAIAERRGQSMAQLALRWVLRDARVCSALIGASRAEQIGENVAALDSPSLTPEELDDIDAIIRD